MRYRTSRVEHRSVPGAFVSKFYPAGLPQYFWETGVRIEHQRPVDHFEAVEPLDWFLPGNKFANKTPDGHAALIERKFVVDAETDSANR